MTNLFFSTALISVAVTVLLGTEQLDHCRKAMTNAYLD